MGKRLLYLYSSNIRPLYEQDILDLLAAPGQTHYQFRYDERHLNPQARESWADLTGLPVLIHYSLQQRARYHDAAFIPVRRGTVVEARKFGRLHVLTFALGAYVSLPAAKTEGRRTLFGEEVRAYTEFLRKQSLPAPYEFSGGLDRDILEEEPSPLDVTSSQADLFQRTAEYLAQTQSFQSSLFLRFAYLRGRDADGDEKTPSENRFILRAGETYELAVAHSQPRDVTTTASYAISAEEGVLRVLGRSSFEIASPYDLVPIVFQALTPITLEARETVLQVEPAAGASGPRLRVNLRIEPAIDKALAGAVATGVGAVLVAIPSLSIAFDGWRILSVALGAVCLVLAAAAGFRRA